MVAGEEKAEWVRRKGELEKTNVKGGVHGGKLLRHWVFKEAAKDAEKMKRKGAIKSAKGNDTKKKTTFVEAERGVKNGKNKDKRRQRMANTLTKPSGAA